MHSYIKAILGRVHTSNSLVPLQALQEEEEKGPGTHCMRMRMQCVPG